MAAFYSRAKSGVPRKKKKPVVSPKVPRTRNLSTETEAQHFGKIRSALRNLTRFWKPIQEARKRAKVGKGKTAKYLCAMCNKLHDKAEVDHLIPSGSLRSYADLPGFCARLFEENPDNYQVLCKECHVKKTHGKGEGV